MKKDLLIVGFIMIAMLLIFIYGRYDPEECGIYPKCPFYVLTGLKCPGCGSQRVIHSLLNFDFQKAFEYNAFLVCMLPVVLVCSTVQIFRRKYPRAYNVLCSMWVVLGLLLVTILWWIIRNI